MHDVFGYWTLCKGGVEEGEDVKSGAIREIKEELNIDIEIKEILGENEYIATHPEKGKIKKQVTFFLAEAKYGDIAIHNKSGGLDDAKWFPISEITSLKMYDNMIPLLTKAIEILTKEN